MWFDKKSNKTPEDKGWEAMKLILDKEMPEKRRKNRMIFWLWPVAASITGAALLIAYLGLPAADSSPSKYPTSGKKEIIASQSKGTDQTNELTAVAVTATPVAQASESKIQSVPKMVDSKQKDYTSKPDNNTVSTDAEKESKPSNSEVVSAASANATTGKKEALIPDSKTTEEVQILSTLPIKTQEVITNRATQKMDLTLVHAEKKAGVGLSPYATAGLFGPPALDRAGFSVGGGLSVKFNRWVGLSTGIQYEQFRDKYEYLKYNNSPLTDLQSFSAYTDVKQYGVPMMLHIHVPGTPMAAFGGVVWNHIRKTENYYAIPLESEPGLGTSSEHNSVLYASAAAAAIPNSYFEWQAGLRLKIWKKISASIIYRQQFENIRYGIVPGFNHLGLNLAWGLH